VPRILLHAINGTGMGHLRRVMVLAKGLREVDDSTEVFVVNEGRRSDALDEAGIPSVRIPLLCSLFKPTWERVSRHLYRETVEAFDPDLVVHDTHFLKEVVRDLAGSGRRQALVLRFTSAVHVRNLLRSAYARHFAAILLPYPRSFFDRLRMPPDLLAVLDSDPRVRFTGLLVEPPAPPGPIDLRRYRLDEGDTVLVSAGAGGKPGADAFYEMATEALREVRRRHPALRVLMVLGPYSRIAARSEPGIEVVHEEPLLRRMLPHFRAAVLLAGYNTLHEAMAARLPCMLMGSPGLYCEDQVPFHAWLEGLGCVRGVRGSRSLARALGDLLDDPTGLDAMRRAWPTAEPSDQAARLLCAIARKEEA
jgi:predicted glycosyltransferase